MEFSLERIPHMTYQNPSGWNQRVSGKFNTCYPLKKERANQSICQFNFPQYCCKNNRNFHEHQKNWKIKNAFISSGKFWMDNFLINKFSGWFRLFYRWMFWIWGFFRDRLDWFGIRVLFIPNSNIQFFTSKSTCHFPNKFNRGEIC